MQSPPHHTLVLFFFAAYGLAQGDQPAAADRAQLPPANSPQASELIDKACDRMLAFGRGTFSTRVEQDDALMRGRAFGMMDGQDVLVDGGWENDLRWGSTEDDDFAVHRGRMVTKSRDGWKLRGKQLDSGADAPFLLDPRLLFEVVRAMPTTTKQVRHVEAGTVRGTSCAVMTISLDGEDATEMASCGILPDIGGGAIMRIGGMFGVVPQKSYRVDLALYIDPDNSDVHRIRAKVYQKDPMLENVQIQIGAGGDGDAPEPEEDESTDDAADTVKKGLPVRKPGRTESMMYFRVDFEELGNASAPALDDSAKLWLQLH